MWYFTSPSTKVSAKVAALEVGEDGFVGLVEGVGQHVQASAVGHADHDILDAVRSGAVLDDRCPARGSGFRRLQG
jgi:hypothetical protein